ncbi:MAG: alpha/beta hydrolase [Alphaproteobacteria bacterium]|nr:alpha/beta hydrolase [Alphaproteobacteria bacterium]MDE1986309.1 alpha/beta hydrolase [Alphaproteobacteria bacterium]MDE2163031.1 alpha/beta hydrolase [Alphaproteobacteria bacterium]MDE2266430.1 alpha/beta hydrolase [Alphaproteobacteria bacterium]MDE2501012.1 alpha/beta hydrolase [Alphaproteobacteria bacterium]
MRIALKMLGACLAIAAVASVADAPPSWSAAAATPAVAAAAVLGDHYPQAQVAFPGGVTGLPDVTYATLMGFRPLTLDLYLPPAAKRKPGGDPVVLYIHGGGWVTGHSRQSGAFVNWPGVLATLAARGYVVASLNYRLSGEARFPAAEQDIKASLRWLRAHADKYGIDKSKALVWGGSAGGHLAALTGVSCGVKALEPSSLELQDLEYDIALPAPASARAAESSESDCVQGVVTWYGVFDFAALSSERPKAAPSRPTDSSNPLVAFLGCDPSKCPAGTLDIASPAKLVKPTDPPMLIMFGSDDKTVPPAQSKNFYKLLLANHVKATLVELPGVGHSFVGPTLKATRDASLAALDKTFAFIDETFGNKAN